MNAFYEKVEKLCRENGMSISALCRSLKISTTNASNWKNGRLPKMDIAVKVADALGVSVDYLLGGDGYVDNGTGDFVTFPIISETSAGYNRISVEEWTGDKINLPKSYLKGRRQEDYFVLRVVGKSMYPIYQDGDLVMVLRQNTLDYSGQVGVVLYNDAGALKKVEYSTGKSWMRIVPINPNYQPIKIERNGFKNFQILGVPKLLLREIED